jgi:hypothetical protein
MWPVPLEISPASELSGVPGMDIELSDSDRMEGIETRTMGKSRGQVLPYSDELSEMDERRKDFEPAAKPSETSHLTEAAKVSDDLNNVHSRGNSE